MSRDKSSQAEASALQLRPSLEKWSSWRLLERPLRAGKKRSARSRRWRLWQKFGWRTVLIFLPTILLSLALGLGIGRLTRRVAPQLQAASKAGMAKLAALAWPSNKKSTSADAERRRLLGKHQTALAPAKKAGSKATAPPFTQRPLTAAAFIAAQHTAQVGQLQLQSQRFGNAVSFHQALRRAGLAEPEVVAIEQAWRGLLDFRRCLSDDQLFVFRRADGEASRLHYHSSGSFELLDATRGEQGWRGSRQRLPISQRLVAAGGKVKTSIGDALIAAGLHASLVGSFVELFAGRADFNADSRPGDEFRIIIEEKRLHGEFIEYGAPQALEYRSTHIGTLRALRYETSDSSCRYFDEHGHALQGHWLRTPLRYDHISSRFNPRRFHPILHRVVPHLGVDFAAAKGSPIWAAASGRVSFAGRRGANGNLVALRHAKGYETFYAHLVRIHPNARAGQHLEQGQLLGYVGSTGRSTGPHLHFGVKQHGRFIDPLLELRGTGRLMSAKDLPGFQRHAQSMLSRLQRIAARSPS